MNLLSLVPGADATYLVMIQMPEVKSELNVSAKQRPTIDATRDDLEKIMQSARDELGFMSLIPLSEQERQEAMRKFAMGQLSDLIKLDEKVTSALDPSQRLRLRELRWQKLGRAALSDPELANELKLTASQQKSAAALSQTPGNAPAAPMDLKDLLSDEQQQRLTELLGEPFRFPEPRSGPPGGGPFGGETKLAKKYDKNQDGWLNHEELIAARAEAKSSGRQGPGGMRGGGPMGSGGRGGPPGFGPQGMESEPSGPGKRLSPKEVNHYPNASLYDLTVLRTLFIDFEEPDWESMLEDFKSTDVEVPATLTVDGKTYSNVGISFRGSSSYFMRQSGQKRSFNVTLDLADKEQRLYGYKSLNLLNSNDDPTFLHVLLYSQIANQFIPTPKANLVRVVINGESWGLYPNVQQFDKQFLEDFYQTTKGTRWKVPGSPGGGGSLAYLGDDAQRYERMYEIKTSEGSKKSWQALIDLCRTLNEGPVEALPDKIEGKLDIDNVLWFLALDVALVNSDGYWIRASDYNLYKDDKNVFHVIPHDMNESFQPAMGPGAPGGPGGGFGGGPGGPGGGFGGGPGGPGGGFGGGGRRGDNAQIDPLIGLEDANKPLRSRLLAVPKYRKQYLHHVGVIARDQLDWEKIGPMIMQLQSLIDEDVKADTRKLTSYAAFQQALSTNGNTTEVGRGRNSNLKAFMDQRRSYLLSLPEVRDALAE